MRTLAPEKRLGILENYWTGIRGKNTATRRVSSEFRTYASSTRVKLRKQTLSFSVGKRKKKHEELERWNVSKKKWGKISFSIIFPSSNVSITCSKSVQIVNHFSEPLNMKDGENTGWNVEGSRITRFYKIVESRSRK